jgi:WS/DGAT/MGAT family acyltransferase
MAEPLTSVDAAWLRMEDPTNLMMVTGVLIFEQPIDIRRLRQVLQDRLLQFDRFRKRVVTPPLGLGFPQWENDATFDLDSHLHRVALPAPGDEPALQALVSDLMSTPLDYSKPLWQLHLIEGFGRGCAVLTRLHHCIADGIALVQVMLSLCDTSARGEPRLNPHQDGHGSAGMLGSLVKVTGSMVKGGLSTVTNPGRALELAGFGAAGAASFGKLVLMPPDPKTLFKGRLGVSKRAAWSPPIPLDEVKAAGAAAGGTINDVLITGAAGALRRYLLNRGEAVEDHLNIRAAVPVNLRPVDGPPKLGNQFGLVFLSLPVGIDDPRARLAEVKRRMDEIKGSPDAIVAFGILNAIGAVPSQVQPTLVEFFGSKATAVMTNVPGPREQLYLAGRPIKKVMFWVPQSGRMGLGVSILSYNGSVMIGVASDAGLVPDPDAITTAFVNELNRMAPRKRPREARAARTARR